jgi:hypothetical protein
VTIPPIVLEDLDRRTLSGAIRKALDHRDMNGRKQSPEEIVGHGRQRKELRGRGPGDILTSNN